MANPSPPGSLPDTDIMEEINPEDSVSVTSKAPSYITHISSTSSKQSSTWKARAKELELAAKIDAMKKKKELQTRMRQLQMQRQEEEDKQEMDELIRATSAKATKIRRRRQLEEEEEQIRQLQIEIDINAEYETAKAICDMLQEQGSVVSSRSSSASSYSRSHGQDIQMDSAKAPYITVPQEVEYSAPSHQAAQYGVLSATIRKDSRPSKDENMNSEAPSQEIGAPAQDVQRSAPAHQDVQLDAPAHQDVQLTAPAYQDVQRSEPTRQDVQRSALAHQEVQRSALAYQNVQLNAPARQDVQLTAPAYQDVQRSEPTRQDVQRSALAYQDVQRSALAYQDVQRGAQAYQDVQRSEPTRQDFQRSAPARQDVQCSAPTYQDVQYSAPACQDVQRSAQAYQDVQRSAPAHQDSQRMFSATSRIDGFYRQKGEINSTPLAPPQEVEYQGAQYNIFSASTGRHSEHAVKQEPLQQFQQLQAGAKEYYPAGDLHKGQQPQQILPSNHGNMKPDSIKDMVYQQGELTKLLLEHNLKASLPQRIIQPFDGDPLEYPAFISAFEYCIEKRSTSNRDRLYYLEQFTRGETNRLVRSCINAQDGYTAARSLLDKKFGNKHKIVEAYLNKMRDFPVINAKDAASLHNFAMLLVECRNTMTGLGYEQELDNTTSMRMLVSKLPFGLRDRWRRLVDNMEEEKNQVVRFSDLVKYVERQARICTNAGYGTIVTENDPRKRQSTRRIGSSFATNVAEKSYKASGYQKSSDSAQKSNSLATQRPCIYCSGKSHSVETCMKLGEKPIGERLKYLRHQGVCFGCLKKATHFSKVCKNKLTCKTCSQSHPTVLHQQKPQQQQTQYRSARSSDSEQSQSPQDKRDNAKICGLTGAGDKESSPTIIPVIVHSRESGVSVETYAFLDDGSDAVFCTEKLMYQLNTKGKKTELEIQTINEEKVVDSFVIQGLEVSDMEMKNVLKLGNVYTQPRIPAAMEDIVTQDDIKAWPYLQQVMLNRTPHGADVHIGMLIGNNVPGAAEPWDVINSQDAGPYACRTLLGWTVHGIHKSSSSRPPGISVNRIQVNIEHQMVKLFNHDFNERITEDQPEKSVKDRQFLADVNDTIKHVNGHYEIGLPLKDHNRKLPNNVQQAEVRAAHLKRRFSKNPTFYNDYKIVVNDMIQRGYAEKIPEEEKGGEPGKIWYIPHHGVYHPRKNKLRVVFDCAANYKGSSLNQELLQGPDLTSTLVGVMVRFRQEYIALMSDIEAMFHQVQVPKKDRDLLRFLWWQEGDTERPLEEYRMSVHLFGATSSPSCASFALRRTAEDAVSRYDQQVTSTLFQNFYVDDCLKSVEAEQEAVKLSMDLRKICKEGGFKLTKWASNSRTVLQSIPDKDRSKEVAALDLDTESLPSESVLGMLWSPESDQFGFHIAVKDRPPTRRGILSVISSVYDPLGFICPATLPAKQIMQDLCKLKVGWDEEIPAMHLRKWQQWMIDLPKLEVLTVDRCYKPPDFGKVKSTQLHHFSDASQKGYGTVSYLRSENESGAVHCAFIMGKARVAPVKQITIPRLELTAATIAVRVNTMIHRELEIPIDTTVYWTDSMSVIRYINNESARFQTFVANRLAVISDGSNSSQWRYINTKDNPADDSSRGLSVDKFLSCERWLKGPDFLWKPEEEWPVQKHDQDLPQDDVEVKKVKSNVLKVDVSAENETVTALLKHYSSWYRLKKAIAWILRVKKHLLHKVRERKQVSGNSKHPGKEAQHDIVENQDMTIHTNIDETQPLAVADMQAAEEAVIRYIQRRAFPQEIKILENKTPDEEDKKVQDSQVVKKSSSIFKLNPFMKNGMLRVGGRLAKAAMPEEEKYPVILPKETHVTYLILREIHEVTGHGGRNHMLSHLHKKFWLVKANSAARRVIGKCVPCRRQKAKVGEQQMADLPEARVTPEEAPFTRVGVDYFGPIEVKRGRSIIKRYGVVFTCLAVRAIHIEKADTLETDSCICAIRRFVSRRGQVKEVLSDNGTNLVGAKKELQEHINKWNQAQIHNALLQENIEWKFNPPSGSHFGGIWERQIRTIRKVMMSVLKEQLMTDEALQTLFCEVESVINSRPITRVSGDVGDLEALTPNHLLLLKVKPALPPVLTEETGPYARKRWKQVQYLTYSGSVGQKNM